MIKNSEGVKVSAKIKAKLLLAEYLKKFSVEGECDDFDELKRTEPLKIKEQADKIIERMNKALVIK